MAGAARHPPSRERAVAVHWLRRRTGAQGGRLDQECRSPVENRWEEINFRNCFATARRVDLYGPKWVWDRKWDGRWYRLLRSRSYRGEPEAAYLAKEIGTGTHAD